MKNADLKQCICNQIVGTTHKDVEKAMKSILELKQLTEVQKELIDSNSTQLQKFDLDLDFKLSKDIVKIKKVLQYRTYTMSEVVKLLQPLIITDPIIEPNNMKFIRELPREDAERLVREYLEHKTRISSDISKETHSKANC